MPDGRSIGFINILNFLLELDPQFINSVPHLPNPHISSADLGLGWNLTGTGRRILISMSYPQGSLWRGGI